MFFVVVIVFSVFEGGMSIDVIRKFLSFLLYLLFVSFLLLSFWKIIFIPFHYISEKLFHVSKTKELEKSLQEKILGIACELIASWYKKNETYSSSPF